MGADFIIAVDLNHQIVNGKNLKPLLPTVANAKKATRDAQLPPGWKAVYSQTMQNLKQKLLAIDAPGRAQFARWLSTEERLPSIFEVLLASINIMETSITQTRLHIDQPDIIIQPPLGHIRFLEFGRAEEIIAIGYEHTRQQLATLDQTLLSRIKL
jgi:NTE family protein